jgi:hypothetical protein
VVEGLEILAQIVHPEYFDGGIPDETVLKLDLPPGQTAPLTTALQPYRTVRV